MLRVLTLSSLFPDATRPNFGVFVERQTLSLAARCDIALEVIAPIGVPPWPLSRHARYRGFDVVPEREHWKGLAVHRPRFPVIPGGNGFASAALMARAVLPVARRLHAQHRFDLIDAQFFFPDGPAARRIARALDLPFSIKARGADIHYWGRQRGSRKAIRDAGGSADGLLAVSAALRDDMATLGIPSNRTRVHYTGVDLDRFRPGDRGALKAERDIQGPLVISVGALIPRKGQALLIDALTLLPGVTLALAGEGSDRAKLEAQAARLGVSERVRFLGSIAHEALPGWLAAADVMALPSSSEGLANAWVEALACGTPIVISDCGGARELLDRPEAGRIVARESGEIASAIAETLSNPPDAAQVRKTAERFTWEANSDALFAHLSALKR
ncbi:glycosyltransferase [Sphingomonas sp. LaA6.9]|uniref:glycosyltransferase n=1 Tax=Sphingomonas sp. LaA6.9 TaxID=2919914 RepID=UPI001F4FEB50|nr:glycosyltransferase [Sphingomonas sp. LaA6.9]MCJ8158195.1 glycosyltransferase [Sphingomonas sp. LaA6.9]